MVNVRVSRAVSGLVLQLVKKKKILELNLQLKPHCSLVVIFSAVRESQFSEVERKTFTRVRHNLSDRV